MHKCTNAQIFLICLISANFEGLCGTWILSLSSIMCLPFNNLCITNSYVTILVEYMQIFFAKSHQNFRSFKTSVKFLLDIYSISHKLIGNEKAKEMEKFVHFCTYALRIRILGLIHYYNFAISLWWYHNIICLLTYHTSLSKITVSSHMPLSLFLNSRKIVLFQQKISPLFTTQNEIHFHNKRLHMMCTINNRQYLKLPNLFVLYFQKENNIGAHCQLCYIANNNMHLIYILGTW